MEHYTSLRAFADSWGLLIMFAFFLSAIAFSFRPGNRKRHQDAANIALRGGDDLAQDITHISTPSSDKEKEHRE